MKLVIWRLKLVSVLHLGRAEPSMTKLANEGGVGGRGGRGTPLGKAAAVDSSEAAEASTGTASVWIHSIGIPGDPGLSFVYGTGDGAVHVSVEVRLALGVF